MSHHESEVTINVFPEFGNAYCVTLTIDDMTDAEAQVNTWIDNNLINWQMWEWK